MASRREQQKPGGKQRFQGRSVGATSVSHLDERERRRFEQNTAQESFAERRLKEEDPSPFFLPEDFA